MRGLDPELKSARAANYVRALRGELLSLSRSCGVATRRSSRPTTSRSSSERYRTARLEDVFGYDPAWRTIAPERRDEVEALLGPPDETVKKPGPEEGPIVGDEAGSHDAANVAELPP